MVEERGFWEVTFRDPRPPFEIQFELERKLVALFQLEADSKLVMRSEIKATGSPCRVTLTLEAALPRTNCYTFRAEAIGGQLSRGWFDFWARDFSPEPLPDPAENVPQRYALLVRRTMEAESHLASVEDVQRAIVAGLREGMRFSTAHKEGGTNITFQRGKFVSSNYGESNDSQTFGGEAAFFQYLSRFYDWEVSRHTYPERPTELYAWRMILRLMRK